MKLKNSTILRLVNSGLLNTTEHDIPVGHAVYAMKFRKAIQKAIKELAEQETEIRKEKDEKRLEELLAAWRNEETEIGEVKRMPLESYLLLSAENRKTPFFNGKETLFFDTFRINEEILAGVLYDED